MKLMTYPVAVVINGKVECIPHIEKDDLFNIKASYIGIDKRYSGYELYADLETGEVYAADAW